MRINYPELKGKAAMISHVMPALLSIFEEHYDQAVGADETLRVKQYDICFFNCIAVGLKRPGYAAIWCLHHGTKDQGMAVA